MWVSKTNFKIIIFTGTQQGTENSRMYNEMVILKLLQAMSKLICNPPMIFQDQIFNHFRTKGKEMCERIRYWMTISDQNASDNVYSNIFQQFNVFKNIKLRFLKGNYKDMSNVAGTTEQISTKYKLPEFSLLPASRGFCLTVSNLLDQFEKVIESIAL